VERGIVMLREGGLRVRIETHRQYSERDVDFFAWVVAQVPWRGGERVLDVGCGNGAYLPYYAAHTRDIVAMDISAEMLAAARKRGVPGVRFLQGDATALPFPAGTFDLLFANHVLFFVRDIDRALEEARRVLRPGGLFVATTNTEDSQQALYALHARALHRVGRIARPLPHARFSLQNGAERVKALFGQVEVRRHQNAFLFPDVNAAMRYYLSGPINEVVGPPLNAEERRLVIEEVRDRIARIIERDGVWRVPKDAGVLLARKEG